MVLSYSVSLALKATALPRETERGGGGPKRGLEAGRGVTWASVGTPPSLRPACEGPHRPRLPSSSSAADLLLAPPSPRERGGEEGKGRRGSLTGRARARKRPPGAREGRSERRTATAAACVVVVLLLLPPLPQTSPSQALTAHAPHPGFFF